jgi:hypothetical protein
VAVIIFFVEQIKEDDVGDDGGWYRWRKSREMGGGVVGSSHRGVTSKLHVQKEWKKKKKRPSIDNWPSERKLAHTHTERNALGPAFLHTFTSTSLIFFFAFFSVFAFSYTVLQTFSPFVKSKCLPSLSTSWNLSQPGSFSNSRI